MKSNSVIWSFSKGEIRNEGIGRNIAVKYKADTLFDNPVVPYLLMILCGAVDGFTFYSLFSRISYDSPALLAVQIAGFLFGFDVVPIFIGIQYKRLRQGLTRDYFVLIMALIVCSIAVIMNTALRVLTVDLMAPAADAAMTAGTLTNSLGETAQTAQTASETVTDPVAIALTIFGIGIPVVTSLGSCLISFITYNPLMIRKRRQEEMIAEEKDRVRRLDAIIKDYDAEPEFAEHLLADDQTKYDAMLKMYKAQVVGYCDYVRERLKEHLADPASNSALSKDVCVDIMARLDRELASMEAPVHPNTDPDGDGGVEKGEEMPDGYAFDEQGALTNFTTANRTIA